MPPPNSGARRLPVTQKLLGPKAFSLISLDPGSGRGISRQHGHTSAPGAAGPEGLLHDDVGDMAWKRAWSSSRAPPRPLLVPLKPGLLLAGSSPQALVVHPPWAAWRCAAPAIHLVQHLDAQPTISSSPQVLVVHPRGQHGAVQRLQLVPDRLVPGAVPVLALLRQLAGLHTM